MENRRRIGLALRQCTPRAGEIRSSPPWPATRTPPTPLAPCCRPFGTIPRAPIERCASGCRPTDFLGAPMTLTLRGHPHKHPGKLSRNGTALVNAPLPTVRSRHHTAGRSRVARADTPGKRAPARLRGVPLTRENTQRNRDLRSRWPGRTRSGNNRPLSSQPLPTLRVRSNTGRSPP